jgi:hypothetical protein
VLIVTGSRCSAQQIRSAAHVVSGVRATGTEPGEKPGGVHHVRQLPSQTPVVEENVFVPARTSLT